MFAFQWFRDYSPPASSLRRTPANARVKMEFVKLLVRLNDLVAHLHHQLERQVGFFHGDHRRVHILPIAIQHAGHLGIGLGLNLAHLVDGRSQRVEKAAILRLRLLRWT